MPVNIVPVDTWPANLQAAADGDAVSQATRTNIQQEYGDSLLYLYNRGIESGGGTYTIPLAPSGLYPAAWAQRWALDTTATGWMNFNVGGTDEIWIPFPALHDCSFTSVTIHLHGDPGGIGPHAGFPWAAGLLPRLSLYSIEAGATLFTLVGSQVDTNNSQATYDALHTITYTPGAAQVISPTMQYGISVRGESGGTAIANALALLGASIVVVPT